MIAKKPEDKTKWELYKDAAYFLNKYSKQELSAV